MISNKNVANAVGGKTARACDSCIKKRARWYCAADDAFLCQACDSSVHSANPLARRHERVLLKTSSFKATSVERHRHDSSPPLWHKGFTRKARTRRHTKPKDERPRNNPVPLVPEVGADEVSHEENEEEQLLYRVPIYDPFVAELCTSTASNEAAACAVVNDAEAGDVAGREAKIFMGTGCSKDSEGLHGFFPSDTDIAEFAADVESLLGKGLENESFGMEELGLIDSKEKERCLGSTGKLVKVEEEEGVEADDAEADMARESFELNFDYESPETCGEEDGDQLVKEEMTTKSTEEESSKQKETQILLRLDYEAVITAWASQGSPWTTGDRPDFDLDECLPDCKGGGGTEVHHPYGDLVGIGAHVAAMGDGGREARVSRYREKRRTRFFSKKIRYEVRKLNAEKRPRMKGRFVKRASFTAPAFPLLNK
ncbi:hypothetical protein SLEP1_g51209 [Rubroshorea leprosula]|uniref:Zinc finger protein CONSTANS-LIKE 16 n=1 Tax=Rubroshorea leprosula TaxID=152421 RepID=A0AAV5M387_9ROSI|nr:hypothetical protein SLEP1_g51209 [Rubroshorea leprosula]